MEALLHKNLLNMFVNMIRNENSIEYEIALRQLVMRESPRESIFAHIQSISAQYGLPSVFELLNDPPAKEAWKCTLNHKIHDMVNASWKSDIDSKSSTKYLNENVLNVGSSHHIWSTVRDNVHDSRRAQIKCKLLTGTYILQANRAAFNQYAVNPTCKLCQVAPETRQHFVGECAFFKDDRRIYIEKLSTITSLSHHVLKLTDPDFLTRLTLDVSVILNIDKIDSGELGLLELYIREYIYRIHVRRVVALKISQIQKVTVHKVNSECKYVRAHVNTNIHQHYFWIKHQNSHNLKVIRLVPRQINAGALRYNNNNMAALINV